MKGESKSGVTVEVAGHAITIRTLLLDFTGTLSKDGRLIPRVAGRLRKIARHVRVVVLTADTFGTAKKALSGLPLEVKLIETVADKAKFIRKIGPATAMATGNGRNDVAMIKLAAVGVAVIGPEGAAGELVRAADIVARDIVDALDLLLNPLRTKATLRD